MKLPGFLKSKYVFYALVTLAVLNVVGYVSVKAWECLVLFVLTAYSTQCYAKNKCVSILAALFVANFVFGCGRLREGLENLTDGPVDTAEKAKVAADDARKACEAKCNEMDEDEKAECMEKCAEAKGNLEDAAAAL
tara:strand:+ start:237 stop:644 length:408 start_codon:yes stop_codon:yes gene_type:complete